MKNPPLPRKVLDNSKLKSKSSKVFDLEVSPQLSMTYGPFHEANILEAVQTPYIFCFSYGDVEGGRVKVVSLPDFPLYKKDPHNDREIVKELYRVLSSTDTVIAHNASFDMGMAKARFIYHKLPPIKPIETICTLKLARRIGRFPSNTLKEIALFFGVKHKMETSKHLWQDIYFRQDKGAWREMCLYNKIDTEVCREIYKIERGWLGKYIKPYQTTVCECGNDRVQWHGSTMTKRPGKRFQCMRCFRWGHVYI